MVLVLQVRVKDVKWMRMLLGRLVCSSCPSPASAACGRRVLRRLALVVVSSVPVLVVPPVRLTSGQMSEPPVPVEPPTSENQSL